MRAVMVGTAMIATSRQRTRQLLIENGEPLRPVDAAWRAGATPLRRACDSGTGSPACPGSPTPEPAWPGPTASGPLCGGGPRPLGRRSGGCACRPPFPLVIERLRTALTPRSSKGNLDKHRATLPASATNRVGTYNHQTAAHDPAFTGNSPELWRTPTPSTPVGLGRYGLRSLGKATSVLGPMTQKSRRCPRAPRLPRNPQRAGDQHALNLGSPLPYLEDLRVPVEPADRGLVHEHGAAADLGGVA